jgi:energy-coupling factor transporter ATP-binding protein EcfA2
VSFVSGSAGFVFQDSSAMIFALNDFCEVAWLDDPLKVSHKSSTVFAVDFACQELGFVDVLKEASPPFQNGLLRCWSALPDVDGYLPPSLP